MFIKFVKYVLLFSAFEYNFSSIPKIVFTLPEKTEPIEYTTCKDINEMEEFFSCCENADTIEIIDQTVPETGDIICDIVKQLVVNMGKFPSPEKIKICDNYVDIILFAWIGVQQFSSSNITVTSFCVKVLNIMAPTTYTQATALLKSQCDTTNIHPKEFADWWIIRNAINILQKSREQKSKDFLKNLSNLKDKHGRRIYAAILEPIGEVQ